jgi:hypothetical protein
MIKLVMGAETRPEATMHFVRLLVFGLAVVAVVRWTRRQEWGGLR